MIRGLDNEAMVRPDGLPTGVRWYNGFINPNLSVYATSRVERIWSARFAELHRVLDLRAATEVGYPKSREQCDVVLTSKRGKRFWIEVKGAWTECVYGTRSRKNAEFKKYLPNAAADVTKLNQLAPLDAHDVGLLLLGFDRLGRPITDDHLAIVRSRANGWHEEYEGWDERHWIGNRVRCWFWWKHLPVQRC